MRQRLVTSIWSLFILVLLGTALISPVSYANNRWGFRTFFNHSRHEHDFWSAISRHFWFDHYENYSKVQQQIRWFQHHKTYVRELTTNARPYIYYILQETAKRDMPAELALMPMIESNYNPFEYSHQGAVGLWQMMPGTASGFGLRINYWYDGRRDIVASTNAALNYLQYLHDYFHNWLLAMAAYDSGEGTVLAAIRHNRRLHRPTDFWSLPLPYETKLYIPKILALAAIIRHPERYGFHLTPVQNKAYFSTVQLTSPINLNKLAAFANSDIKTIRQLNAGFRRRTTAPDRKYDILVPVNKAQQLAANLVKARVARTIYEHETHHHQVRPGESLSIIAAQFHTTVSQLKKANHLKSNIIHIGQHLAVPTKIQHQPVYDYDDSTPSSLHGLNISETGMPGPKRVTYTVRSDDTVSKIAARYHVKPHQIYYWNKKFNHHRKIQPKQELIIWIPHRTYHRGINYRVRPGDSLSTIAYRFNTTTHYIREANNLDNNLIRVGQRLYIPVRRRS